MSRLQVNWMVRRTDADGLSVNGWHACAAPSNEIIVLVVSETATVQLTYSDGSTVEYRIEGITDVGPNDSTALKY